MAGLFGSSKKKKKAKAEEEAAAEAAAAKERGDPVIGKASAKAMAAHAKAFGAAITTVLGGGKDAGLGETGSYYGGFKSPNITIGSPAATQNQGRLAISSPLSGAPPSSFIRSGGSIISRGRPR